MIFQNRQWARYFWRTNENNARNISGCSQRSYSLIDDDYNAYANKDGIYFLIDFIHHMDVHLAELVAEYGVWVYAILFLILFCETGLVVTAFLPGDS